MFSADLSAAEVCRAFLDTLHRRDLRGWVALWQADGMYELPFAPAGTPSFIRGTSALERYMGTVLSALDESGWRFDDIDIVQGDREGTAFVEYTGKARIAATGREYAQRYIARAVTSGGRIVVWREYWNPLVFIESLGSLERAKETFAALGL